MQINIQSHGFGLTDSLRAQAERRVRGALGTCGRVHNVVVRLGDDNGPRGGVDKRCTVHVTLSGMAPVIVAQEDSDLYAAIDMAAHRAGHAVARRLKRAWRMQRHGHSSARRDTGPARAVRYADVELDAD